jgi:hypothetical protein
LSVNCNRSWDSPGTLLSSTNKTDHHDITEILLKVALNTIKQIAFVCLFYTDTLQEWYVVFKIFELTTSVVIGTDCIGSCESYYRTITATTAPYCNGFFMRILNYQLSSINYVLLSNDICKGVKRVIIDKGGLFAIIIPCFIVNSFQTIYSLSLINLSISLSQKL